jgi:hypothetical protein
MRPLLGRLLVGLLPLLPLTAVADPVGYVVGFNTLYRVDLASGQSTTIGPIGFTDVEGLALSANGTLYGVADAGTGEPNSSITDVLIRIDTTSGTGTLVGQLGLQGLGPSGNLDYGLAFTADGRLWLSSDSTQQLWEVSVASGFTRLVGSTGRSISGLGARGNDLYGVSVDASPSLYRLDTGTAAANLVGALNVGGVVADAGLDFDAAGQLWAVLDPEPSAEGPSRVVRIDGATGAGTVTANVSVAAIGMEGLAIAPTSVSGGGNGGQGPVAQAIPGPSPVVLVWLAAFAAFLGLRRLRRSAA